MEMLGFEVNGQETILKALVQKSGFIQAQGQDMWARRAALKLSGVDDDILSSGKGLSTAQSHKESWKQGSQDPEGTNYC